MAAVGSPPSSYEGHPAGLALPVRRTGDDRTVPDQQLMRRAGGLHRPELLRTRLSGEVLRLVSARNAAE